MKGFVLYALAIIGILSLAWWLYASVAAEPIDIAPDRFSTGNAPMVPDLAATLAANLDAPVLEGNQVELLVNGDEIFPAMLTAIDEAHTSVNLLSYIYWQGEMAREFADHLMGAVKRGVAVRLLVDAYGARKMDPALVEQMRAAGIDVAIFRPLRWTDLRRFNNRTHRKVMVVDGRIGFTGGVGIADEWTGDAQDANHWRDDHFRLQGPVVRYLQGSFAENWRQASGEVLSGRVLFPTLEPAGPARIVPLNAAPGGSISDIAFVYWFSFHAAHHEVQIATPYFVPDPDLDLGILLAARRGVKITLLVPGPHQDSTLVRYASRTYYRRLLQAGVRIFEFQPTMMHAKVVTVDDNMAVIGSSNFDSRSFEMNYEVVLAVYDPTLVTVLKAEYAHDVSRSKEVTMADVDSWSLPARVRDDLAALLREKL